MKIKNDLNMSFPALSANESFARGAVAAFVSRLDPTIEEVNDIKTAVSEAVTNCIVHAYGQTAGTVYIYCEILKNNTVKIRIKDRGCGIEDIEQAMQPLYSSLGGERAGLGFAVMQSFSDALKVSSKPGRGTSVTIIKKIMPRYPSNG